MQNYHVSQKSREVLAKVLSKALADSYVLKLKTQNYHWNVEGPMFQALHTLFEQQYTDLHMAIDTVAERIRALDMYAPASFSQYAKTSSIAEDTTVPKAEAMVASLARDNLIIAGTFREVLQVAEQESDDVTADIATQRLTIHEKNAWMLRSMVKAA